MTIKMVVIWWLEVKCRSLNRPFYLVSFKEAKENGRFKVHCSVIVEFSGSVPIDLSFSIRPVSAPFYSDIVVVPILFSSRKFIFSLEPSGWRCWKVFNFFIPTFKHLFYKMNLWIDPWRMLTLFRFARNFFIIVVFNAQKRPLLKNGHFSILA